MPKAEIEDLLRITLTSIVKDLYGADLKEVVNKQKSRPLIELFSSEIKDFSKYKLAKAFIRWTRENDSSKLDKSEIKGFTDLISKVNKVLK